MAEQYSISGLSPRPPRTLVAFQVTRQHRRFVEFADAVRRYIGVCYGAPGIGKTLSARTYAGADDWERWAVERDFQRHTMPGSLLESRTLLYTPEIGVTPRRMNLELFLAACALGADIDRALDPTCHPTWNQIDSVYSTEMVIIDEADLLRTAGLEQLRDFFDRRDLGMILIGMPGFDRQLARYPQLYSRIGFAHQYKPLDSDDLLIVLANYWHELGLLLDPGDENDVETVSAVVRITGGNFRLIERLMTQVARVMDINQLDNLDPPTSCTPPAKSSSSAPPSEPNNENKVSRIIRTFTPHRRRPTGGRTRRPDRHSDRDGNLGHEAAA